MMALYPRPPRVYELAVPVSPAWSQGRLAHPLCWTPALGTRAAGRWGLGDWPLGGFRLLFSVAKRSPGEHGLRRNPSAHVFPVVDPQVIITPCGHGRGRVPPPRDEQMWRGLRKREAGDTFAQLVDVPASPGLAG